MKKCFTGIAVLAACMLASPAAAQETDERITLDTVVITADRTKEKLREISQNVTIITSEEIEHSPAVSVVELLKKEGIQTTWSGSVNYGNEGVVMRGGKSSTHGLDLAGDVLVLVDGRRVGSDNFSLIGLNNVERIEIIRGPGAVQYGSAAIGGVINIITKRGKDKPEVNLEAGFGSHDMQRYKGFASGKAGQFDIAAWASYATGGNPKDGEGNRLNNSGMEHLMKYGFNAGWNFNDKNRLGISFNGMDGNRMEMGPSSTSTYGNQYQDRDYYLMEMLYEGGIRDDSLSWLARYYFGRTSYDLNRESLRTASYGERDKYSKSVNKLQGGQAQMTFAGADRFTLVGGMDVLYYDMEQDQPYSLHTTARQANYTDSDYLNIGTFLLGKLHLLEKRNLTLSAGGRYDYFRVNIDSDFAPDTTAFRKTDEKTTVDNFIPSFGIAYSPLDFLKLRANCSHAFRMPTPRQLGGIFAMGGTTTFIGNPDLDPEESRTWDVGFDVMYKAVNFSFTYFNTKYKDMIVALPAGSVPGSPNDRPYANLSRAYVEGVESALRYDLGHQFNWPVKVEPYVSLTHLGSFRDGDHHTLPDLAENTVSWGLNFEYPEIGLASSLDFTYFDRRVNSVASDGSKEYTPGGATVVDFSLSQRIAEFEDGGDLKIKFSLLNLFDKYYTTNGDDYMPGRTFYVGMAYTF